nr:MAG TPA: hypothetical protein [Caudoviricetes sp.]
MGNCTLREGSQGRGLGGVNGIRKKIRRCMPSYLS